MCLPFSRLNGHWMVTEIHLSCHHSVAFQPPFSHHSVDWKVRFRPVLAQASLLWGSDAQVSNVDHGPLVYLFRSCLICVDLDLSDVWSMSHRGTPPGGVCDRQQSDWWGGCTDPGPLHPQTEEGGPGLEGGAHWTYPCRLLFIKLHLAYVLCWNRRKNFYFFFTCLIALCKDITFPLITKFKSNRSPSNLSVNQIPN